MTDAVLLEDHSDRLVARLNRPLVRNAIDTGIVDSLHEVCAVLERAPKPLLLVGQGDDFSAGADVAQLRDRRAAEALRAITSTAFERVQRLSQPVIALLDGYVLGGGAELAYAADFRIATSRVTIGNPEPQLGIIAGAGATWRLKELVGEPIAKEILLLGRMLDAAEAHAIRLWRCE
jgi:enoyl-CoA hydratase